MSECRIAAGVLKAATQLSESVSRLHFSQPITHLYNPLAYAWKPFETYVRRFGDSRKKVLFLGMNPGPWGMAQTGVPFGEITAVREWMGIEEPVSAPGFTHPKRPIEGFSCGKSEVSGRRLWGLMNERFGGAENFFRNHFVANYCPLVFMTESGKNFTPDNLPACEKEELFNLCDTHLGTLIKLYSPEWVIGIGRFAELRIVSTLKITCPGTEVKTGKILHPSPASPAANRGWAEAALKQLAALGVWNFLSYKSYRS